MRIKFQRCIWIMGFLAVAISLGRAQTDTPSLPADTVEEGTTPPTNSDAEMQRRPVGISSILNLNPPPDGRVATGRGFVLGGLSLSESAESSPAENLNASTSVSSVTRVFGNLQFLKFRRHSETAVDYVGGGAFFTDPDAPSTAEQFHRLDLGERILWSKGQFSLGDSFGDLPGGQFGSSVFGGFLASEFGFPVDTGLSDFLGSSEFGELAQQSHITNVSLAQVTQNLTARTSLTLEGAYSITAYFSDSQRLVNSRQISAHAGYTYQMNPRTSVGATYEYRHFQFPQSGTGDIGTNLVQLFYEHRLSRRLTLGVGAGPEIVSLGSPLSGGSTQVDASGYGSLRYRLRRASLRLSYDRLVTKGSGFFAGANRDTVRFSGTRPIGRSWQTSFDVGFTRARRLEASVAGIPANVYLYGFTDASVERRLGRRAGVFVSYQFNAENFDGPLCVISSFCNRTVQRNIGLIGLNWHIRPIPVE
jgi:hypothetical protein